MGLPSLCRAPLLVSRPLVSKGVGGSVPDRAFTVARPTAHSVSLQLRARLECSTQTSGSVLSPY